MEQGLVYQGQVVFVFNNPNVMQPFNLIQTIPNRLKGIRIPSRASVAKFFYNYFLDLSDEELAAYQKSKDKGKA